MNTKAIFGALTNEAIGDQMGLQVAVLPTCYFVQCFTEDQFVQKMIETANGFAEVCEATIEELKLNFALSINDKATMENVGQFEFENVNADKLGESEKKNLQLVKSDIVILSEMKSWQFNIPELKKLAKTFWANNGEDILKFGWGGRGVITGTVPFTITY